MNLEKFKKLVNSTNVVLTKNKLEDAYKLLEIDSTNNASLNINEKLYENIRISIAKKEKNYSDDERTLDFINLRDEFIYKFVLYNEDPTKYLKIISVVNDCCRREYFYLKNFDNVDNWIEAIKYIKTFNNLNPKLFPVDLKNLRKDYPKQYDIAKSLEILSLRGCKIEIKDAVINFTSGFDEVLADLEKKIKELGGLTIIKMILFNLSSNNLYSIFFERYFITRKTSGLGYEQIPQIPFGYIINLALKYPSENSILTTKAKENRLNEIIYIATAITNGMYGVQSYNMWENIIQNGETIINHCVDIALWDSIFNIQQSKPSISIEVANKLFSFIANQDFEVSLGFSKKALFDIINFINSINNKDYQITLIHLSFIHKKLKLYDKEVIKRILYFLSHTEQVNKNFKKPSDYTEINFFLKPLIKIGHDMFVLINKSLCAPNYFEALATYFRNNLKERGKDMDAILGLQLEAFLKEKFKDKSITTFSGDYKVDGIAGECDILIESEKTIVLIEFKKKPLTRKSKSGIDINILLDLADSVLTAQLQAGRTEIILREKGEISLIDDKGNENVIYFKNRKIERVALTQLEFGGFQDQMFIKNFLQALLTHSYHTTSNESAIKKKFKKLENSQKTLVEQHNKLTELDVIYKKFPFFSCWFLGLPQLLEIINFSDDNNSFCEVLTTTKHVSLGTYDWYSEFYYAKGLNK